MESKGRAWSVVAVVLLLLILVVSAYNTVSTELSRRARTEAVKELVEEQRRIANSIVNEYEGLAYDNPDVDRITEQQLLATEHQLVALQLIALQNAMIIELLAGE